MSSLLHHDAYVKYLDFLSGCSERGDVVDHRLSTLSGWLGVSARICSDGSIAIVDGARLDCSVLSEENGGGRSGGGTRLYEPHGSAKVDEVHSAGVLAPDCSGGFSSVVGDDGGVETSEVLKSNSEHGRWWAKNRSKREKKKNMRQNWRREVVGSGGCVSDESVVSVATVDTRTAVEIEASQSLAARRVVENKLAIARGRAQLAGFGDKAKSDALARLAAARMEQRINEAKAKSQASFKKCDESLKSLGSSGSAGEYALKIEVRKARESEKLLTYVQAQATMLLGGASPEMVARLDSIPKPVYTDVFEDFGDCSSDCSPEEVEEYYRKLNELNEEESARFCTQW